MEDGDGQPLLNRRAEASDESGDESETENNGDDDDGDNGGQFPTCYPVNPPLVEQIPEIAYNPDTPRSSPSERNLEFQRMVQNNFVPFSKGLKGEPYRRRTNYEHQQIMGYVL